MKLFFVLFIQILSFLTFSQEGNIQIIEDNRIHALVEKQSKVTPPDIKPEVDGFRVQVFFDSDRNKINSARSKLMAQFPKLDTYVIYNAPNYFLKAGDYRTRLEAEKLKSQIEIDFPTSFIISEKIYLPRLEKDETK